VLRPSILSPKQEATADGPTDGLIGRETAEKLKNGNPYVFVVKAKLSIKQFKRVAMSC